MNVGARLFIGFALFLLVLPEAATAADLKEGETGVRFKQHRKIQGSSLSVAGAGVREAGGWIDVYAGALYVDAAALKGALAAYKGKGAKELASDKGFYEALIAADVSKAFVMHMVRTVGPDDMRDSVSKVLARHYKPDATVAALMAQFVSDLEEGDEATFLWLPGGKTQLIFKGNPGKVHTNRKLQRALQLIWLGRKPISSDIKEKVTERIPGMLK